MIRCVFSGRLMGVLALVALVMVAMGVGAVAQERLRVADSVDRFLAIPGAVDLQAISDILAEINADADAADAARQEFMDNPRGFLSDRGVDLEADRFAILGIDMREGVRLGVIAAAEPRTAGLEPAAVGIGGVAEGVAMAIIPAFEPGLDLGALDSFFTILADFGPTRVAQIPRVTVAFGTLPVDSEPRELWRSDDSNRDIVWQLEAFDDQRDTSLLLTFDMDAVPEGELVFVLQEPGMELQALIEATFVVGEFFSLALMLGI